MRKRLVSAENVPGPPILAVDVGGSHVKVLLSGESEPRRTDSGPTLTPAEMVATALRSAGDWHFERVAVGIPAPVRHGRVLSEPFNLGKGWVEFDYEAAFGRPTRVMNDAAMQALGSYEGGTTLFLGLGTGLGSTLIADGLVLPLELGHLPFRKETFEDYLGERGRKRFGNKRWRRFVDEGVGRLAAALEPDSIVIGGGNAARLEALPAGAVLGANTNAFLGAFRVWQDDEPDGGPPVAVVAPPGPDDAHAAPAEPGAAGAEDAPSDRAGDDASSPGA